MTFKPNEAGFAAFDEALAAVDMDWAEIIAQRAREVAPVRTGTYRDSIRAVRDGEDVFVLAAAPYALWVEFGTADTPTFAPLHRAVDETAPQLGQVFAAHGIEVSLGAKP